MMRFFKSEEAQKCLLVKSFHDSEGKITATMSFQEEVSAIKLTVKKVK